LNPVNGTVAPILLTVDESNTGSGYFTVDVNVADSNKKDDFSFLNISLSNVKMRKIKILCTSW
jgi:hypothetical protein